MIFKSILLENFRQFKGQQELELLTEENRNVVIVTGPNGAGKTNLLKAINWCIYGEAGDDREIINRAILSETTDSDGRAEAKVTVRFSHDGRDYICRRKVYATDVNLNERGAWGDMGKKYSYDTEEDFYFGKKKESGETDEIPNPNMKLNNILPKQMRSHFFFDGEKIDKFTKPGHESKVREGIRAVLQTEALERAAHHLEKMADDYNSALRDSSDLEVKDLAKKRQETKDKVDSLKKNLSDLEEEEEAADHAVYEIDKTLKRLEKTKNWVDERDKLTRQNESLEEDIEDAEKEIRDRTTLAYLGLGEGIYEEARRNLEEMLDGGDIHPTVNKEFIKNVLNSSVCICGREFEEGSSEEKAIRTLLDEAETKTSDFVLKLPSSLKDIEFKLGEIMEDLNDQLRKKTQAVEKLKENKQRLKDISDRIESEGEEEGEDIEELERKRREFKEDLKNIKDNKWELEHDLENEKDKLEDLKKELKRVRSEEKKIEKIRQKQLLAEKSAEVVGKVSERFLQGKREAIEKKSRQIFKEFIWKDSQFQNTTISEDFELEVLDRWGVPARKELSAGERQCFSLAFIMGMAHSVNIEAPFILDTPFARISEKPLKNIATNLPDLADQLIMLATPKEFPREDREQMGPKIAKEYRLNFDDSTGCTSIQEIK